MTNTRPVSGAKIGGVDRLLNRRIQVVVLYGGAATYFVTWFIMFHADGALQGASSFVGLAVLGATLWAAWRLLRSSYLGNAGTFDDSHFDERQRARKYAALRIAYPVLGMSAAALIVSINNSVFWPVLRTNQFVNAACLAITLLWVTLPAAILAWTEPDTIPE